MELLSKDRYSEFESFVKSHKNGGITQSVLWHGVKHTWGHEVVVSRDEGGNITGGVSVLLRRMPLTGTAMMYSPRGPVCDYTDRAILEDLKSGVDTLAKKHRAHLYKMDPDIGAGDIAFLKTAADMGFSLFKGGDGFETIQARFNYRLYLDGRDEDALFMNLTQKTRYNIRIAMKKGVTVEVRGKEALGDFMRLMAVTGERDGFSIRSKAYFEKMLHSLGGHIRLYMAYYEGEAIAGAVTTNYGGKACYIYGASDNAHRNVMATYLIQWEMIRWAVETGCIVYDFQGVSGNLDENDPLYGLYRFKRGFNGTLDELAGEFDFIYMPVRAKLIKLAINLNEKLRALKRRLRGRK